MCLHRHLLTALLLFSVLVSLASCEEKHQETKQEKQDRIRKMVFDQLKIPPGSVSYDTRRLSEVASESIANKVMGNKYMLLAGFTVINDSAYDVKDFQISFSVTAPSGTEMRSVTSDTIYEIIPAKESRSFGPMEVAAIKIGNPAITATMENFVLVNYQID